ncbi:MULTISPECIES: lactonase family protein [unclassified Streptomyces]|uniref:lactonase family protein n=1 Tax=unclassified Streptomyces TaxID=2593676 RepID=UPI001369D105|nr:MULTISPECIES: lactonase family protein [unclassified Streptomyces]NEA03817.1 lactonase family protein [Streptomyces sp. SID10116]MYY81635.1 beta-propeller fold lactonase family protein [Streptomyces sp. SID335]MYZ12629.1 beta-propeller fold lactonase family protein [Streptomyces sp. SID337]NDZ92329.1 lactonase family protein [Streptomyces sp. SID10115]NEB45219.1 lactonase family protein [Streptomyces sp. SID339]
MTSGTERGTSSESGPGRRRFIGALVGAASAGALASTSACGSPGQANRERSDLTRRSTASSAAHHRRREGQLFLGTYTSQAGGGKGIGLATYDETTGRVKSTGTLTGVPDPSYLALHPSGRTLYTVNEREKGGVTAIALSHDGEHDVLGTRDTGGNGPCHLSVHPSGRWLLSANYGSGSVAVHPVEASGALGERTDLVTHSSPPPGPGQQGPHAHQIVTSPDGRHVLAVDLGNDTLYTYRLDEKAGTLRRVAQASLRPGAGPRHLTFHPSGRFAYVADELDNTVVVCAYDPATGRLTPGEPQSTGTGEGTSYPAQIVVTREGRFAFLANRGHNSITRYAIEGDGARLRLLDTVPVGGDFPRQLAFSPSQRLLFAANQKSSSVSVFRVDARSGALRLAGKPFAAPIAVCVLPL